ncbi:MAG: DUF2207 domain-containing protein [Actinomycetota bacterium]
MRRASAQVAALAVVLAVVAALAASGAGPAWAQGGEGIRAFDITVEVRADGALQVTERIRYDFGPNERRGIFREIPVRFDYEPDPRFERVTRIDQVSVRTAPGTPGDLEVTDSGRVKRFRIGDPDTYLRGVHDYTISYRVRGALNAFEEHDELFWNATGNNWGVPIDAASVTVSAPGPITQVACFAGPTGSRLTCDRASGGDGPQATFSHSGLSSFEGVTVVVGMPKGTVTVPPPILDEKWDLGRAFSLTPASIGLSAVVLLGAVAGAARLLSGGRDRRWTGSHVDTVFGNEMGQEERVPLFARSIDPVEYEPPDKIRPGQLGTLIDEVANPLDVTATIVDLAVRGYLRIEEIPKKGWFGKPDWRLTKLKGADGLLKYERLLLNGLFQSGDEVELSDLKQKFADRLRKVQEALYEDVVAAGWFPTRPDKVRALWRGLGVFALLAALAVAVFLIVATKMALVGIPLVIGAIVLLAGAGRMPHRTPKGHAVLRRTNGFRRFIEESEAERARFAERANLFSEYLPYAIVFGATDKWARAFSGLETELAQATAGWYVSSQPFSVNSFGSSMDSFSVTTAGTIVSTAASSGSSGFGGGGSSGGGFGGGGGGSW